MIMQPTVLIVDDELEVCLSLKEIIESSGYRVLYCTDSRDVPGVVAAGPIDLILLDIRMPYLGGIDLLMQLKEQHSCVPTIVISGHATVENAVRVMRFGALNLYTKPIQCSVLMEEIDQITRTSSARNRPAPVSSLIAESREMRSLLSLVERAAPTDATVLITGESGTGKELIATTFHRLSRRSIRPYVRINCAAIPETLLESEMFGYEKGAFTDARELRRGKFECAEGGTIFLDEIGDMSLHTQAKMLRVLEDKKFSRLGGTELIDPDVRIVAATNKNLPELIGEGLFREDLYYRINVVEIEVPPLRKRKDDIMPLIDYYLDYFNRVYDRSIEGISAELKRVLMNHDWPGNVRELRNFVERGVIFSSTRVLGTDSIPRQYKIYLEEGVEDLEDLNNRYTGLARGIITEALKKTGGNKCEAARMLKITRKTLYNRMKKLNME
ncbi:MAG: sigma-54-dependent Fis family transcriptional regulator [Spirochaetales bacterium]|nr:sigma-54-dependent Fis family transcriptional regulator [Spirochaetales bacterium]